MKNPKVRTQDLLEKVDSQFKLVTMAAKRVKALSHGAQPLAAKKAKLIDTVLEEIVTDKITYENEKK